MSLFRKVVNFVFGISYVEQVERLVKEKNKGNKYWKNFSYKNIDSVDLSGQTRKEFSSFCAMPKSTKANMFELVLNPAVNSIQFDMDANFSLTKPTVAFLRTDEHYAIDDINVREIARIFLKFKTELSGNKTVAEARYLVVDDGKKATFETVICNHDGKVKEKTLMGIFAAATTVYVAIQFAFKNRPSVFVDPSIKKQKRGKGNGANIEPKGVPVRRLVIDHNEEQELLAGHFTRKMKCAAWGVSGHPRHLRDGRVIWIRPYVKGEDRNNPKAYTPKIYEILQK